MLEEFAQLVVKASKPSHPHFSAEQAERVLEKIAVAQKQVDYFGQCFDIPASRKPNPSWVIQVGVSQMWEILEDCKSEPMRGYGKVPEATKPILDAEVQRLIDVLQDIADAAKDNNYNK